MQIQCCDLQKHKLIYYRTYKKHILLRQCRTGRFPHLSLTPRNVYFGARRRVDICITSVSPLWKELPPRYNPSNTPEVSSGVIFKGSILIILCMKGSWANHQQSGLNSRKLWTRQTVPQARTGMSRMASWWKFLERYINIPLIYPKYSNHFQWYPINLQ